MSFLLLILFKLTQSTISPSLSPTLEPTIPQTTITNLITTTKNRNFSFSNFLNINLLDFKNYTIYEYIVIGLIGGIILLLLICICCCCYCNKNNDNNNNNDDNWDTGGSIDPIFGDDRYSKEKRSSKFKKNQLKNNDDNFNQALSKGIQMSSMPSTDNVFNDTKKFDTQEFGGDNDDLL